MTDRRHPATIAQDAQERPEPAARPARVRMFDFDRTVPLADALDAIAAALNDEGLALLGMHVFADRSYSALVTIDGRAIRRVFVPTARIVAR